jgi:hypothetical protein
MRVLYLDQNKWIQVARVINGKKERPEISSIVAQIARAVEWGSLVLPLSEIHYLETARILDGKRRARLGRVMWRLSRGFTLASQRAIVERELTLGLAKHYSQIAPDPLELIGRGLAHAFGEKFPVTFSAPVAELLEEALLTGEGPKGDHSPPFRQSKYQQNFAKHLANLPNLRKELPRSKLDDALHAIVLADILEPLNEIVTRFKLPGNLLEQLGRNGLTELVESMPTRQVDLHLHRQMLKNPTLRPKLTDLEDWAGLGKAVQYCDHVVCEKHFASMIGRDGFETAAQVHSSLMELEPML